VVVQRISQQVITQNTVRRLNLRLDRVATTQTELATGRRIQVPSDDPAGTNRVLLLQSDLKARTQEQRNAEDGETWVNLGDSKLQDANTLLQRANELAQRGAQTIGQDERDAIAAELTQIRDQLVGIANSKHLGRGLFAGYSSGDAVTFDSTTNQWQYTGTASPAPVSRRISQSESVDVNVLADDAFGFSKGPGQDVFSVLDTLAADVRSGNLDGVDAGIGGIETSSNTLLSSVASLGATQNRIDSALTRNLSDQQSLKAQMSDVEDVDMAEAIMNLQTQQVAYQATLGALAKAIQPSLVDFLH
jgi:flagellar hook-associated protein 3 FlgL